MHKYKYLPDLIIELPQSPAELALECRHVGDNYLEENPEYRKICPAPCPFHIAKLCKDVTEKDWAMLMQEN